MLNEYIIFAFICFVMGALGLSLMRDMFDRESRHGKPDATDIKPLPPLPVQPSYPPATYQSQPVFQMNSQALPLDPATVAFMLNLFQRGAGNGQ